MIFSILSILIGYLLGSFPSAYIIARVSKGIDIREVDNGNVGTASVLRTVGPWQGALVFILDAGKGYVTLLIANLLGISQIWIFGAGFAAVLGHCFPVYLRFHGGQGVATVIGIFLFLAPIATLCTLGVMFFVLLFQYRIVLQRIFLSILISCPTLPLFIWLWYQSLDLVIYAIIIVILIVIKNIARVINQHALMSGQRPGTKAM